MSEESNPISSNPDSPRNPNITPNPPPAPTQPYETAETAETKATRHPGRGVGALGTGVGTGMAQGIRGQIERVGDVLRRSFGSKEEELRKSGGMCVFFLSLLLILVRGA